MPDRVQDEPISLFDDSQCRTQPGRRRRMSHTATVTIAGALLALILGSTIAAPLPRLFAASAGAALATTTTCPPAPACPTADPTFGDVYYGAAPQSPDGGASKPVLLFVHGLGGQASDWWIANDMYTDAWGAGYRTAFVELTPLTIISNTGGMTVTTSPEADTFTNGITLSQQIITVTQHYQVPFVDVIGHSKGGVDAQTAIVYDNPRGLVHVRNLITLASPHYGTPLGDFLCVLHPQLAALIGVNLGPGLCGTSGRGGLTVAQMQTYRANTDAITPTVPVTYFVAAGADWQDSAHSSIQAGGKLLQTGAFGFSALDPANDNDGLVPVESACLLQNSNYLFVKPYDHFAMAQGSSSFAMIDYVEQGGAPVNRYFYTAPYSGTNAGPGPSTCDFSGPPAIPTQSKRLAAVTGGSIMRSGSFATAGTTAVALPVESRAQLAGLQLLVSGPKVNAALVDPSGVTRALPAPSRSEPSDGVFGKTWLVDYQTTTPARGTWHLKLSGPAKAAYLLVMAIKSPLQVTLTGLQEGALVRPGQTITLQASARDGRGAARVEKLSVDITGANNARRDTLLAGTHSVVFRAPTTPGGIILTATVTGKAADGSAFERSFIRSLAVVSTTGRPAVLRHK